MRVLIAPALALLAVRAGAQGEWVDLPSLNVARQETTAARVGDLVFVVGGLVPGAPLAATASVERYDDSTGGPWTLVAPLPQARDHAAAAAVGGRVYVAGGFAADFVSRREVWAYDPPTDTWTPRVHLPSPRGAAWAAEHGGIVYVFGGTGPGGVSSTVFAYDPSADAWSTRSPMPTAREHLVAVTLGDFIHVVGGRSSGSTAVHERYDPATDTWTTLAPMTTARSAMGAAALQGRLYVGGGEVPILFDLLEVYDPPTDAWATLPSLPDPRHGLAAIALPGRVVFPGGGRIQGVLPTTHVDAYVPAASGVPAFPRALLLALGSLLATAGALLARRAR